MSLVVLATGGTGGHIYPAVATAKELMSRGHTAAILGQRGGMEERVAAEQGLVFHGVEAGKLARSGQGRPNPAELLRAGQGVLQARALLGRLRPGVVVGFGGFASLPGVLGAQGIGIPTVLHEQNAKLGLTQRLAVRKARAVGTAYEKVLGLDPKKAHLVGMPVREERMDRRAALAKLGLQDSPLTIFVMGGSQGSLFLNNAVPDTLQNIFGQEGLVEHELGVMTPHIDLDFDDWRSHGGRSNLPDLGAGVQVIHSTGPRWLSELIPRVKNLDWYHVSGYVDAVAAWSAADLAITRGGTGTLAEAAFHGVPLIMVPLPESAENHQYHNAMSVQNAGAGRVVEQAHAPERLGATVLECAAAGTRIAMRAAAQGRSQVGAAARFADLIERHLPDRRPPDRHLR